ncbi:DUF4124 domain-containing protein [Novilysobacter avium]|uniref:DUF4124 domain-containing protein n=1 Tax=Novilysobacter avium TaxID=2781023 RepID=UPI001D160C4C|nr:DUF4124 domain-containing protein [Lysobacter avium]
MKPAALSRGTQLFALLLLAAGLTLPTGACADGGDEQVTIYRCTDAQGRLSLRDSPCRRGEQQEMRGMQRPQDPPPPPPARPRCPRRPLSSPADPSRLRRPPGQRRHRSIAA